MVTYTYMGYVTAKYARGAGGLRRHRKVRTVMAEYPQGWLAFEDDFGENRESGAATPVSQAE